MKISLFLIIFLSLNKFCQAGKSSQQYIVLDSTYHQLPNPHARLLGHQNILQVYLNGEWRGVWYQNLHYILSEDGFNWQSAQVVCYMLGMGKPYDFRTGVFLEGRNDFWIDNVNCSGDEENIFNCDQNEYGNENCYQNQHVSVYCTDGWNSLYDHSQERYFSSVNSYQQQSNDFQVQNLSHINPEDASTTYAEKLGVNNENQQFVLTPPEEIDEENVPPPVEGYFDDAGNFWQNREDYEQYGVHNSQGVQLISKQVSSLDDNDVVILEDEEQNQYNPNEQFEYFRDLVLQLDENGYIPEFRTDYKIIDKDGEVYEPISGPYAQENGQFYNLDQIRENRRIRQERQLQQVTAQSSGNGEDGESQDLDVVVQENTELENQTDVISFLEEPYTFDFPYIGYDGEFYYFDEYWNYEVRGNVIFYAEQNIVAEQMLTDELNDEIYERVQFETDDGEIHTISGPYYNIDGEYVTSRDLRELIESDQVVVVDLLTYPNNLSGPYYNIDGEYFENQDQEGEVDEEPIQKLRIAKDNTVQIFLNGWGGICANNNFAHAEATVVCRHLGYREPASYGIGSYVNGVNQFSIQGLQCSGNESSLFECQYEVYTQNIDCRGNTYAQVSCKKDVYNEDVRTVGPDNVLEIFNIDQWEGLCIDNFDQNAAVVVCRQLGLGQPLDFHNSQQMVHSPLQNGLNCSGQEQFVSDCQRIDNNGQCSSGGYVSLTCERNEQQIRLFLDRNNSPLDIPILQVYINGKWGSVCSHNFNHHEALVACKNLGYRGVEQFTTNVWNQDNFYWIQDLTCRGDERSIFDCGYQYFQDSNCGDHEHVSLKCTNDRQIKQSSNNIIEVFVDGQWKTICDEQFDHRDANAVCHQLGYSEASVFSRVSWPGNANFWRTQLNCVGDEQSVFDCPAFSNQYYTCSEDTHISVLCLEQLEYLEDLGLIGQQQISDVHIILRDDEIQALDEYSLVLGITGKLSILKNGQTKSFCQNGFDNNAGIVACRELGQEFLNYVEGQSCDFDDFWIDNVYCLGTEARIDDCHHSAWGDTRCNNEYDCVQLICQQPPQSISVQSTEYTSESTEYQVNTRTLDNNNEEYTLTGVNQQGVDQFPRPQAVQSTQATFEIEQIGSISEDNSLTQNPKTGVISITHQGETRNICGEFMNSNTANIICRQLYGVNAVKFEVDQLCDTNQYWLQNVKCSGLESQFSDCSHREWGETDCRPNQCVSVMCENHPLVNALYQNPVSGVISFSYEGKTSAICDDGFNDQAAQVVCMELYGSTFSSFETNQQCDYQEFWLDSIVCTGFEQQLFECSHDELGVHDCNPQYECVKVYCEGGGPNKIVLSQNQVTGVISISYQGQIKAVCDDWLNEQTAQVVCQQLYGNPSIISYSSGLQCDQQDFWLDDVQCNGMEQQLQDCQHNEWGQHNCNPANECFQVYCSSGGPQPITSEANVIQNNATGVISITYAGETRGICDDGFDEIQAQVVCLELYGSPTYYSIQQGQQCDYNDFWLDDVRCSGYETQLSDCQHRQWGQHDCNPQFECVSVFCTAGGPSSPQDVMSIIALHQNAETGVISISYGGEIRSICDDGFNEQTAQVVCMELYGSPEFLSFNPSQQCEHDNFWLDNLRCTGYELQLQDCEHNPWGNHDCNPQFECVQVYCQAGGPSGQISSSSQLVQNSQNGVISISHEGEIRAVCDDGFNQLTAEVVCRELYGSPEVISFQQNQNCDYRDFWLDNVSCYGTELSLENCQHNPWGNHDCNPQFECVQVFCQAGGPQSEQQPESVSTLLQNSDTGVISIQYQGEIRAVCDDGFSEQNAQVVCRELYGSSEVISFQQGQQCDQNDFWLDNVGCFGNELQLQNCQHNPWGTHDCNPQFECVQVFCVAGGPSPSAEGVNLLKKSSKKIQNSTSKNKALKSSKKPALIMMDESNVDENYKQLIKSQLKSKQILKTQLSRKSLKKK